MTSQLHDSSDFPVKMGKVASRELQLNGIKNITDVTNYTEKQLLAIHGVGPKAIRILKDELAKQGLALKSK